MIKRRTSATSHFRPRCALAALAMPVLVFLLVSGSAWGQNRDDGPRAGDAARTDTSRDVPEHSPPPKAAPASTTLQQNGNSLLKASLSRGADDGALNLRQVSWTAVAANPPRKIAKHDLVTIIIREESQTRSKGSSETSKESSIEAKVEEFIALNFKKILLQGGGAGPVPPSVKASAKRETTGEASVDRSDSFTARITGEVIDVKPNGTLVIQARKTIVTDNEEQQFTLSGSCRGEDITADNTVLSTQLYDLRLTKQHQGAIYDATKRGWLIRKLDEIDPF